MTARAPSAADCIYCGQPATTRDHVPPRLLLERPFPANLRTVPSCIRCNRGASLDEQYFLVLLGQISTAPTIVSMIDEGGLIDRTLSRSPGLEQRLINALDVDNDEGRVLIRPEMDRVHHVLRKIAIGLFALRYGRSPEANSIGLVGAYPYNIRDDRPMPYLVATITERFRAKPWRTVQRKVFSYIFVRDPTNSAKIWCVMDFYQTLWGVVHFPHPRLVKFGNNKQLRLPDID